MSMRSVQKPSAITVTSTMLGCFRQQQKTIEESLTLIQTPSVSRHQGLLVFFKDFKY
nr:hypothetical protein L204_02674 [Cryptococcus depauperatus CBS 7855]